MIRIGLAGWGDHDDLYPARTPAKDKLAEYAKYFSVVEVDSSFYAVLGEEVYRRWLAETPPDFTLIIKAYQGMTGHSRANRRLADRATCSRLIWIRSARWWRRAG